MRVWMGVGSMLYIFAAVAEVDEVMVSWWLMELIWI